MIYYKKIHLTCEEEIRNFAIKDIEDKNVSVKAIPQVQIKHNIPTYLKDKINAELKEYGIPNILYAVSYVRQKGNFQGIHIDGNQHGKIDAAINIPLKGFANSCQIWYTGHYTTKITTTPYLTFYSLQWLEIPKEECRLVIDQPYLLRVGEPHSALAGDEDRWVFTMRFIGNPSFNDLVTNGKI